MQSVSSLPVANSAGRRVVSGGGFRLTEARYPASYREARHTHQHDLLAFPLRGAATLGLGPRQTDCLTLGLSIVPGGVEHAHTVLADCRCLILECGAGSLVDEERTTLFERPRVVGRDVGVGFGLQLSRELSRADDLAPLAIEGLLLQLRARLDGESAGRAEPAMPAWLRRVRDRIHASYTGPIRIAELAAEASVHPVYLVRAFRRRFGMPPAAYVRSLRLAAAARSLVESRTPLSEIATRSGFADQSQFTRHFTRLAGQSPGAFRSAARAGEHSAEVGGRHTTDPLPCYTPAILGRLPR